MMDKSKRKIYYTEAEVDYRLNCLDDFRMNVRNIPKVNREIINIFGFETIYFFCKLKNGWVQMFEPESEYSLCSTLLKHGSLSENKLFNEHIKEKRIKKLPITRLQKALSNKKIKKEKKKRKEKLRKRYRRKNMRTK